MRTMNRITLVGRLGKDPETKIGASGLHWMQVSVATNRNRRDGDKWVEETDWHHVRVFGKDAEALAKYARKGTLVTVEGEVRYETWNDKDGHKHWSSKIYADRIGLLADLRAPNEVASGGVGLDESAVALAA